MSYDYQSKVVSVQAALTTVKSNDVIVTGLGPAEGKLFLQDLHTIADKVENVTITNCLNMTPFDFFNAEYKNSFKIDGWFFTPDMRRNFKNGNIAYIPNHLHLAATRRLDYVKPTIYVGSCSAVDKHGFVSLSTSNTYEKRMIEQAEHVILEVNPNFPITYGDLELHVNDIDMIIEADYPVPELPVVEPNEKDRRIGAFIAEHIHDGDCLQLGIGGIPNAVAEFLVDKKDLGIHTEMMTSNMAKLAKMGVITGKKKNLHPGKIVATFVMGNKELYDYVDGNPSILLLDGHYVNAPEVIGLNDNMVSINTSIEVDLTGQVCSESIGTMQVSGTGGQSDTATGAQKSKNGRSFIALYSTTMVTNRETGEKEEISKIVPMLNQGAIVSLSRNDVDNVVTEYGVAALRGTNTRERVERLIAIAHPKFRESLYQQAYDLGLIR